jgi:iron(III) transport system substrate-binding protein
MVSPSRRASAWIGAVLGALLFASTATAARAQQAWQAGWASLLEAARKEGVVAVSGPPGVSQREAVVSGWTKAFPDIKIEYTAARGTEIVDKVVRERSANLYNWDIILASTNPTVFSLVPIHALAPLRDALILPGIADDKAWIDGFDAGFMDAEKKYLYSPMGNVGEALGFVNRDCVPSATLSKVGDLKNAALMGKIAWLDPLRPGSSSRWTWIISLVQGEDWLKDLFEKQDVTFSRDIRQITDWLVTCTKPVGIGIPNDTLQQMQKAGLGLKVEELVGPAYSGDINPGGAGGNESIAWYNEAPHPNAAKLFVNWYLSHDFQQFYADTYKDNSRRVDTKPGNPDPQRVMVPGVKYFNWSDQAATLKIGALQAAIAKWGVLK